MDDAERWELLNTLHMELWHRDDQGYPAPLDEIRSLRSFVSDVRAVLRSRYPANQDRPAAPAAK